MHRLNQYAAAKIDKNITEETVKVRLALFDMICAIDGVIWIVET